MSPQTHCPLPPVNSAKKRSQAPPRSSVFRRICQIFAFFVVHLYNTRIIAQPFEKRKDFFKKAVIFAAFPLFSQDAPPDAHKKTKGSPSGEPFLVSSVSQIQKPNVKAHTSIRRTQFIAVSIQTQTVPLSQYAGQLQLLSRWIDFPALIWTYRPPCALPSPPP